MLLEPKTYGNGITDFFNLKFMILLIRIIYDKYSVKLIYQVFKLFIYFFFLANIHETLQF